jgi:hypothetical protein
VRSGVDRCGGCERLGSRSGTETVHGLAFGSYYEDVGEDGDEGAFVEEGFEEDAVDGGGDFEGGFVGFDFGDYVAGGDLFAFAFDPAADQALLD